MGEKTKGLDPKISAVLFMLGICAVITVIVLLVVLVPKSNNTKQEAATIVIKNAVPFSVAVKNNKILATGTDDQLAKYIRKSTKVFDAKGVCFPSQSLS